MGGGAAPAAFRDGPSEEFVVAEPETGQFGLATVRGPAADDVGIGLGVELHRQCPTVAERLGTHGAARHFAAPGGTVSTS